MQVLPDFLFDKLDRIPDRVAIIATSDGEWVEHTWRQLAFDIAEFARRLINADIAPGDRIALISENRYEWPVIDLAIQICGAISVPLNPLVTASQTSALIAHCEPVLAIVSDETQAKKLADKTSDESGPFSIWILNDSSWFPTGRDSQAEGKQDWLAELAWMRNLCANRTRPDSTVTILYTSGTTGNPKGVMLSHQNLVSNALAKVAILPLSENDVRLCWLPMVHVFARLADLATAWLAGCVSVISRGKAELFDEIQKFRPTYINGVPWMYEKCCRILESKGELNQPGSLKRLLGGRPSICNCGGAPLPKHVLDVFARQKVFLVNGYGLTEAAPVLTSNSPEHNRSGSVGRPVPGVDIRIDSDGIVFARGPNIMQGYFRDPQATTEAVRDGWLDTGDIGRVDEDGYLWLTGRKKELIITLTGRKISPSSIENCLLADPLIQQCMVVGDNRRCLVALVVPEPSKAGGDFEQGMPGVAEARMQLLHDQILERIRGALSEFPAYEQIAELKIISEPFSIENGLATAKQSLRRHEIEKRYSGQIESLYKSLHAKSVGSDS